MARGLMRDVPQLVELGCDARELLRRLYAGIELPPGLEWAEPDAAAPDAHLSAPERRARA
jgi:hypothetical protein